MARLLTFVGIFSLYTCKRQAEFGVSEKHHWTSWLLTEVKEEKMKEKSDSLSISLGMFICSFNQKKKNLFTEWSVRNSV